MIVAVPGLMSAGTVVVLRGLPGTEMIVKLVELEAGGGSVVVGLGLSLEPEHAPSALSTIAAMATPARLFK